MVLSQRTQVKMGLKIQVFFFVGLTILEKFTMFGNFWDKYQGLIRNYF